MNDDRLASLRASWQLKHDEATAIINDASATGEALVRAEKAFDERDAIGKQIDDRNAELKRVSSTRSMLKDRSAFGVSWMGEPARGLPFSGAGGDGSSLKSGDSAGFKFAGMEAAGHAEFQADGKGLMRLICESGPGTFGESKWGLLNSFEYKRDWIQYLRKGTRQIDLCSKTLQVGLDDQGGVFAPAEFLARVIGRLPAPTSLRALVTTLTTGRDTLVMPRKQYASDDKYTTAFRATWTGEIPSSSTIAAVDDTRLLGNVEIPVHTAMLTAPVSKNNLEDSAFPLQAWLESELNQVIDLLYEDMILNGTGYAQPFGILSNAASADRPEVVLSGSAGALAYDGLVDLQTAVAPQYEGNARFVMNKKSTLRAVMKLKDSSNRPLFAHGVTDDGLMVRRERTLLGDPITVSQFMPDVSSTTYPIIYGDFLGYYLAQRVGFSIQVLDQTAAKQNQIELVGRVRFGGKPVEHWRLKIQKSNNS